MEEHEIGEEGAETRIGLRGLERVIEKEGREIKIGGVKKLRLAHITLIKDVFAHAAPLGDFGRLESVREGISAFFDRGEKNSFFGFVHQLFPPICTKALRP